MAELISSSEHFEHLRLIDKATIVAVVVVTIVKIWKGGFRRWTPDCAVTLTADPPLLLRHLGGFCDAFGVRSWNGDVDLGD